MQKSGVRSLGLGLAFVVVVVVLLIAGGFGVRGTISSAFDQEQEIAAARSISFETVKDQLDEETGVRGFAATNDTVYLQPYTAARGEMDGRLQALRGAVDDLKLSEASDAVVDAADANQKWIASVAEPLVAGGGEDPIALQRRGKGLVDRFRADFATIDKLLVDRESRVNAAARSATDRVNLLVASAIVLTLALALVYVLAQMRAAQRLNRERERAATELRELASLRAAYEAEKRIADTLQDAFAQRPLPTLPLLQFSATYVPATDESKIGGDWYDAIELPGNRVLFAIGDVTGHGIDAAVTMNRARQSLITSALRETSPAEVLKRVNTDLLSDATRLVTAIAGFADADTFEFIYSVAGHPPPLLLEPGRPPRLLDCGSLPLGTVAAPEYTMYRVQSVPGASLVLYTDGAVEHSRNVLDGEALLLEAATKAMNQSGVEAATYIHNAIFDGRAVGDDVAILTIGFAVAPATGLVISADSAQTAFSSRMGRTANTPQGVAGAARRRAA